MGGEHSNAHAALNAQLLGQISVLPGWFRSDNRLHLLCGAWGNRLADAIILLVGLEHAAIAGFYHGNSREDISAGLYLAGLIRAGLVSAGTGGSTKGGLHIAGSLLDLYATISRFGMGLLLPVRSFCLSHCRLPAGE